MPSEPSPAQGRIRFGEFEVDLRSHELLRAGRRIRLQEKSFLVLQALLAEPGQAVTREELAAALWPKEYFVDAEHGLNTAVRRLREALDDSADEPRWIETLPKVGYRFIGTIVSPAEPIDRPRAAASEAASASGSLPHPPVAALPPPAQQRAAPPPTSLRARRVALTAAVLATVTIAIVATVVARSRASRVAAGDAALPSPAAGDGAVNELLARGRYLRNHKRFAEAKKFVEEALKLDPGNPEAVAGLALGLLGEGRYEQARATARRALELDPGAWEAHRALGVMARLAGDFAGAERYFRRAIDAGPGDYKSKNRLARHLLECGRIAEAKELIVETRRLAPDDPDVQNIWMEYALRTGDYETAIRQGEMWTAVWEKQLEGSQPERSAPGVAGSQLPLGVRDMLGLAYLGARRHEEAVAQFLLVDPDDDLRLALALGYAGRSAEARAILAAHERDNSPAREDPGRAGAMAMAYVVLGDFDPAFAHLDRQLAERWYPAWLNCRLFHPIRGDPRWAAFAARLEREFFSGAEGEMLPVGIVLMQAWPRPERAAASPSGS